MFTYTTMFTCRFQVDSAFYPLLDGKMCTSQRVVMLCDWEGNRRPDRKQWQPTTEWMTYSHLWAACLYTGISSGPNAR